MPLSRESIVEAALGIVAAEGWPALSMRRLAVELDVWPMALYRHFEDKDALVAAAAGAAAREVASARGDLAALARSARGLPPTAALVHAAREAGAPDDASARAFVGAVCGFAGDDDAFALAVNLLVRGLGVEVAESAAARSSGRPEQQPRPVAQASAPAAPTWSIRRRPGT